MTDFIIPAIMFAVYVWVCWHDRATVEPEPVVESKPEREYELTLMHPNGEFVGAVVAPRLPRHFYIADGRGFISDDPTPPVGAMVTAFDRIGSSVYIDDERDALFVRRES